MKRLICLVALTACSVDGVVLVLDERGDASVVDGSVGEPDANAVGDAADALPDAASVDAQQPVGACRIGGASDGFYANFPGPALDPARWLVAQGSAPFSGSTLTFVRDHVTIEDGALVLRVDAAGAAAVATRDLFASGTYQVQGRVGGGLELALWWRRDDERDGTTDIATPGLDATQPSYARVRMRTSDGSAENVDQLALAAPLDDGADHTLRFDRYNTATPGARFWVDDVLRWDTAEHLATARAGRMWIVASAPPGITGVVRITNAFVTPFGNDGDRCQDGELAGVGLVPP